MTAARTMAAIVTSDGEAEWCEINPAILADWLKARSEYDADVEVHGVYGVQDGKPVPLEYTVHHGSFDGAGWAMAELRVTWPDGHVETCCWAVDGAS